MFITVLVGAAYERPPTPQNIGFSCVTVQAPTELAGELLAAQTVASRRGVVMPTSTEIVEIVP